MLESHGTGDETRHRLTEKNRSLFGVMAAMMQWADTWVPSATGYRQLVHDCSRDPVTVVTSCGGCGEPLAPTRVRVQSEPEALTRATMASQSAWRSQLTV